MLSLREAAGAGSRSGRAGPMGGGGLSPRGSVGSGLGLVRSLLIACGVACWWFGRLPFHGGVGAEAHGQPPLHALWPSSRYAM
jgi:hypothetical protein